MTLLQGDCLELMKNVPDKSVDLILCDLPYGTTEYKWDTVIPLDELWEQYHRIIKDNGAIVLFCKQPFTSLLITSNLKNYKYNLVWKKNNIDNPLQAKRRFTNITEDIAVFYKRQCCYNPQGIVKVDRVMRQSGRGVNVSGDGLYKQEYTNYPRNILEFPKDGKLHPTQKPVALLEYLIKTYTNEGDTVLDNCMGSGSTGVACKNTNREFIGMELDENYYKIACERLGAQ